MNLIIKRVIEHLAIDPNVVNAAGVNLIGEYRVNNGKITRQFTVSINPNNINLNIITVKVIQHVKNTPNIYKIEIENNIHQE